MECPEFRRICDTEPDQGGPEYFEHAAQCDSCARYAARARRLDALVLRALRIDEPVRRLMVDRPTATHVSGRRRFLLAASGAAVAIGVGSAFWLTSTESSALAAEVVEHIRGEPESLEEGRPPLDPQAVQALLAGLHVRLAAGLGPILYSEICVFRGKQIPHLVVQTDAGPVTVLVLSQEAVLAPIEIDAGGFRGRVVPVSGRSLAIVGRRKLAQALEARIVKAVQWRV